MINPSKPSSPDSALAINPLGVNLSSTESLANEKFLTPHNHVRGFTFYGSLDSWVLCHAMISQFLLNGVEVERKKNDSGVSQMLNQLESISVSVMIREYCLL